MTTSPTEQEIVARAIKALVPMGYGMTMGEAIDYAKASITALDQYRAKNEPSNPDRRYTTAVFEFDIRTYAGNPLKAETPFGKPIAIGFGDAFAEQDEAANLISSMRAVIEEKDRALDRIAKDLPQRGPQGFEDFSTAYSRIKHIARSTISDGVK